LRAFENTPVDIVVCIHNALPHVRACLESLEKTLLPTHRLILVDDGSEKETAGYLEAFASRKDTVLLMRNDAAIGYTKSANLGLRLSSAPFVILLNSDTIVSRNWALKLLQAAYSRPHIGIVGPMSNAASYQSVPYVRDPRVNRLAVNDLPQNMTVEDVDRWCEENAYFGLFPLTQLINGFCYGIKREVIEHIGYLDEEGFPIGYGEEDDYSLRALKAGFMHAVATHCYVYHAKSKSFGDKRRGAMASSARQTLRDKHGELRLRAAVVTSESNPLLAAIRYKFCRLVGLPFAGAKIARLNLPTYGNEVFEPVIAVVCSSDPRQARMPPSAHIRLLERIRSNPGGIHAFRRMHAEELLAAVKEGKIRAALIQRTHMPANIWEKLKPYAASGQLRYLLDLDDDLLHVPAHKDPQKIYESYRPVLTDIIRHAAIVTVSTERLYQKVAALAARVALLPNGLSRRIWGGELPQHSPDKIFRVLYMGSKTHDADLRMLMPALERVAARHSEFRLSLVGVVHEKFTNPPRWMECVAIPEEATEYPLFILWLKQQAGAFDCGIAPLEGMDFNANKSPLKVLEYAGLGLPVLASAGSVYGELQGQAPFMVLVEDDPSAWEYALLDMNAKRASLPEQGLAMREWVLREHALDRYADIFDEHITALMP
jgi:GT2 family glycosyltransferase